MSGIDEKQWYAVVKARETWGSSAPRGPSAPRGLSLIAQLTKTNGHRQKPTEQDEVSTNQAEQDEASTNQAEQDEASTNQAEQDEASTNQAEQDEASTNQAVHRL